MNMQKLLGKRALIVLPDRLKVEEYVILEVSPSGDWVKLRSLGRQDAWENVGNMSLIEVLDNENHNI